MTRRSVSRVLLFTGVVLVVGGLAKLHATANKYDFTGSSRFAWGISFVVLLWAAAYGTGLPDLVRGRRDAFLSALAALVLPGLGISVLQLLVGDALLPRSVVFGSLLALLPWYLACELLASHGRLLDGGRERVVVVAAPEDVANIRRDLARGSYYPAQVAGSIDVQDLLGAGPEGLRKFVEGHHATLLVLSRAAQDHDAIVHEASEMHVRGIRIRTLSLFYEQWLGKLPVSELERVSLMFDISELHRAVYARASRILDVALSIVGCFGLAAVVPLVAAGNAVANRGSLLYRQPRIGKNGKRFDILKFRTMRASPGGPANEWATEDDPRITPFGRLMRVTHIDELPQLVNVLRGDLSLVGPRPEQPHYVEELIEKIPFYNLRHVVRPGLTGWAQVNYGYAGTESDALEKLQYEFYYLRHQTLGLDARILLRTVRGVIRATGR